MATTRVGITGVGQIAIPVGDVARAASFYRDKLRLRQTMEFPGLAFFQVGEVRLMLSRPEGVTERHSSVVYFRVDDVFAAREALASRGVDFRDEPHVVHKAADHDLWMAFFSDGEGNVHALMQERPKAER